VLSGGEKSRVSLGKILLSPTNLLLLDEPTNHLDVESCDSLIAALDDFPGAVIIVTHSEMFLHHLAKRLIVFNEDRVFISEGTYQDFLDKYGWEPEVKKLKKEKTAAAARKAQEALEADYNKKRGALLLKTDAVEKLIGDEELALESANLKLAEAAGKLSGEEIQKLQIKAHGHQEVLDASYKELEELIAEMDTIDRASSSTPPARHQDLANL
ncbi:MAG TPA: ATP-binding cassette domain-containing protein, partial [Candidatus Sulfotelmatobacter sp.]|nr:ATP-binding cassette domain-containing protein [Candidatus Sulfotelmatobacter sp.]